MSELTIIIGQGGGPTPVINDQAAGILYEANLHSNIRVLAMRSGLEGFLNADSGNVFDISHWDYQNVRNAGPGAILHSTRMKLKRGRDDAKISQISNNLDRYKVKKIAYIGGNDSADILAALGRGVHVSKTVDNDLPCVHNVSGYGTSSLFNATMIMNLVRDIGSFRSIGKNSSTLLPEYITAPVTVYQTMGRDTGWLAFASAYARIDEHGVMNPKLPPDIIWPREIPFEDDRFLSELSNVLEKKGKAFVVIGEELVYPNGNTLAQVELERRADLYTRVFRKINAFNAEHPNIDPTLYNDLAREVGFSESQDDHGHIQHGRSGSFSYADFLAGFIQRELKVHNVAKIKETPIEPQHLQRAAYVKSKFDSDWAFEIGREAVRALLDSDDQKSIVLQKNGSFYIDRIPISNIAGKTRKVPLEFIEGIRGPTQQFVDEFLPTIGGPGALPHYWKPDFSRIVVPG